MNAGSENSVHCAQGEIFEVKMAGNPTTGYSWKSAVSDSHVEQVGEPVYNVNPHAPGMVGVGGMYTFKFKALKAGNAKIGFSYGRPWEKDTPSADTKTVSVVVDGSN